MKSRKRVSNTGKSFIGTITSKFFENDAGRDSAYGEAEMTKMDDGEEKERGDPFTLTQSVLSRSSEKRYHSNCRSQESETR